MPGRAATARPDVEPSLESTDGELVRAVRASRSGSLDERATRAAAELVRRHQRGVYALALSLLHDRAEAEDMAQEAFLRAFRNLDLLADGQKFGIWLRRIAFGVCVDWLRAFRPQLYRSTDTRPSLGAADGEHDRPAGLELPDLAPSPLERLERAELAGRVMAALDRLPARYRVPFTLFHIDGLGHAKVARALGAPEGTVRSLVARARRKLAALLASDPEAPPVPGSAYDTSAASLDVLDEDARVPRFLHVLNGDTVRDTLEHSDVPGAFAVWADVLHEGPVSAVSDTPSWRQERSRFISARGYGGYAEALRTYEQWDAALASFREYDEVVLWFEHDLFDQLLLVRHLDWFSRRDHGATALSVICVGEFRGVEPFHGLGQLSADQLASLLGTRQRVTPAQLRLGRETWAALTASDPSGLEAIMLRLSSADQTRASSSDITLAPTDVGALPFLHGALRRFLEEYPSVDTGLPRTERQILECLVDGPLSPFELFRVHALREERVFMGDATFWARLLELAAAPSPLIALDATDLTMPSLRTGSVVITETGRDVLAGRADWVRLHGIDRWLGGVHLDARPGVRDVRWRWDRRAQRLVPRGVAER